MLDPLHPASVLRTAEGQHGLVTRDQLRRAGVSWWVERARVEAGLLIPAGARTFRVAGAPPRPEGFVLAACLDLGGVASHLTAAWLHGLLPWPGLIDVTVEKGRSTWRSPAEGPPLRVHTTTSLPRDDVLRVGAVPVTSLARTLLGCAALVPHDLGRDELVELVSRGVEDGRAFLRWLWWVLERRRCRGRNGVAAFETALAERSRLGPTESWLEREVLSLLEGAGLPLPVVQRRIRRRGRWAARVDFLYEDARVVVEAMGYAHHRTREDLLADTMRANDLTVAGYAVLQVSSTQVTRHPATVVRSVRSLLDGARAPSPF